MKAFVIGLIFLISLMPFVLADTNKLEIRSLKAYVDGNKDSGTLDAKPESEIKIKFDVKNIYDTVANLEIRDIGVTSYIKSIDDGDDLDVDEEPDINDLDPGEDDSAQLVFSIPLEVEDNTYDLEIKVEGKDANGTSQVATDTLSVRIKKEKHDVWIRNADLYTANLKCSRTTQLGVSVINMGTSNEDAVLLTVTNNDLGISKKDTFDLDNDPFGSDSKYSNTYPIIVSKDQEAGTYPINVKVSYNSGAKIAEKNVDLVVEDCVSKPTTVVVQPTPTTTTTIPPTPAEIAVTQPEEQGILASLQSAIGNKGIFALILLAELVVIIIGVVLVVSWIKRK